MPMDPSQGEGLVWTSYETGLIEGPFRPEHVKRLALTHSLAVTGKVLVAALEEFPAFTKDLQYLKVRWCGVPMACIRGGFLACVCARPIFFRRRRRAKRKGRPDHMVLPSDCAIACNLMIDARSVSGSAGCIGLFRDSGH